MIWLLASRHNNHLPFDAEWIGRRINATEPVNLEMFQALDFIEVEQVASEVLAQGKHDAIPERETETETETEREREGEKPSTGGPRGRAPRSTPAYSDDFLEAKNGYPQRAGNQPWRRAWSAWSARLREGREVAELIAGVNRYRLFCEATHKAGTETVMQAATFFGPDEPFAQAWTVPKGNGGESIAEHNARIAQEWAGGDNGGGRLFEGEVVGNG